MLTIRLTRKGRKNKPFFRIVVVDKKKSSKGGRAVDVVGYIDPLTKRKSLKKERILHWMKNGAQPSATVHNLLVSEKIITGKKIHVSRIKKSAEALTTKSPAQQPVAAAPLAPEPAKQESAPDQIPQEKPQNPEQTTQAAEQKT